MARALLVSILVVLGSFFLPWFMISDFLATASVSGFAEASRSEGIRWLWGVPLSMAALLVRLLVASPSPRSARLTGVCAMFVGVGCALVVLLAWLVVGPHHRFEIDTPNVRFLLTGKNMSAHFGLILCLAASAAVFIFGGTLRATVCTDERAEGNESPG